MASTADRLRSSKATWLCVAGLLGMIVLAVSADQLFRIPGGRQPAILISVMRNRAVIMLSQTYNYYDVVLEKQFAPKMQFSLSHPFQLYRNTDNAPNPHKHVIDSHDFREWRMAPNLTWEVAGVTTNSLGRPDVERPVLKPAHTRRIALLGDSLASGFLIPPQSTLGPKLEQWLNTAKPAGPDERYEVDNFACPAYLLPQILDTAVEDVPPYKPDVYLVDLSERSVFREWDTQLVDIIQKGIDPKYDFLRPIFQQAGVSSHDSSITLHTKLAPYRIPVLRGTLLALKAHVAKQGASLVLLLFPSLEPGDLSRRRIYAARQAYEGLDIPIIDLTDTFDGYANKRPLLAAPDGPSQPDVHLNDHAYSLAVTAFDRRLREQPKTWAALTGSDLPETTSKSDQQ